MVLVGDCFFCREDKDSLLANRLYHVTQVGERIELDGNPAWVYSLSDLREYFLPAVQVYQDLQLRTAGKKAKEIIHHLIPYFYYDPEVELCYVAPELVKLYTDTDDFLLIVRVVHVLLEMLSKMSLEEVEAFYALEWDEIWYKLGLLLQEA